MEELEVKMNVWWTVSVAGKSDWFWFSFNFFLHPFFLIFGSISCRFLTLAQYSLCTAAVISSHSLLEETSARLWWGICFSLLELFPTRNLTSYNGKSKQIFHIIISRWELKGTLPKAREDVGYQGTGGIRTVLVDWEDGAGFCLANQRMKWSKNKALDCWLMLLFFLP